MICTKYDNFIRDHQEMNPSWVITLDNDVVVYQDDYRPNVLPHSAWERLGIYCKLHNRYIKNMSIQFRSNKHALESDADGYFFSKGVRGGLSMPKTLQLFLVGTLNNNILNVTCWKTPEMLKEHTEQRRVEDAGICLIKKNTNLS